MDTLRGWMGGQPAEEQDAPGASVLAEWNKYSGGSDVEGGRLNGVAAGPAPSASTPFMVGLAGAKFMGSALSGSFNRAASGLHEGATSVGSSVARSPPPLPSPAVSVGVQVARICRSLQLVPTTAVPVAAGLGNL